MLVLMYCSKAVIWKEVKLGVGRRGVRLLEEMREWRLPGFLYVDDLILNGDSEEELKAMV